jgi:hypothetical protein
MESGVLFIAYDEQMVRRLIEKITVFDDKLIFKFKSGMSIELKR